MPRVLSRPNVREFPGYANPSTVTGILVGRCRSVRYRVTTSLPATDGCERLAEISVLSSPRGASPEQPGEAQSPEQPKARQGRDSEAALCKAQSVPRESRATLGGASKSARGRSEVRERVPDWPLLYSGQDLTLKRPGEKPGSYSPTLIKIYTFHKTVLTTMKMLR